MSLSVKEWRRARGFSQQKMADTLGIHVNTWCNWESEPENITIANAQRIANVLDVPMDEIIFLPEATTKCSKDGE